MAPTELSFMQIYNLLLAGKKLALEFPDQQEAEKFRIRMHQFKKIQEKEMLAVGIITEADIPVFSCMLAQSDTNPATAYIAVLQFRPRIKDKTFSVIELPE